MASFELISTKNRERYFKIVGPIADLFARAGVHPNILSIAGLLLSMAAGLVYGHGSFFWAAWVVVLAGICDTLDGRIARQTNTKSAFGAFFDSTLDRYSDMFLFIGLAYYFAGGRPFLIHLQATGSPEASPWTVMMIILAIAGSFMVSYTRARAEGLGMECKAGMMQRPERIILLIIGSLLGSIPVVGILLLKLVLLTLAVSTNLTAGYRIMFIKNRMLRDDQAK
ncbi:MAG: CDP-alcohol phosphatidyltransferase family protein [Desulfobacterota bacterium]|jgi:CDP-diacylglycerol--glycerol-3-phosphate 3-phosphatidyltransferase|nr:CDP-alcohol phosphatidyltransferase family protein [Thermodesulfobacteriota bacterium]